MLHLAGVAGGGRSRGCLGTREGGWEETGGEAAATRDAARRRQLFSFHRQLPGLGAALAALASGGAPGEPPPLTQASPQYHSLPPPPAPPSPGPTWPRPGLGPRRHQRVSVGPRRLHRRVRRRHGDAACPAPSSGAGRSHWPRPGAAMATGGAPPIAARGQGGGGARGGLGTHQLSDLDALGWPGSRRRLLGDAVTRRHLWVRAVKRGCTEDAQRPALDRASPLPAAECCPSRPLPWPLGSLRGPCPLLLAFLGSPDQC